MSIIKADVTAENRPAYFLQIYKIVADAEKVLTKINVVFRSSSYFLMKSWSCSSAARLNFS